MQLEEYWGIGPKTRTRLEQEIGTEAAVRAIRVRDVHALVEAGLSRGRATQILRRANGTGGMDILATRDARSVYQSIVALASAHALSRTAADRIRVLTPLPSREARQARLDHVTTAIDTWTALSPEVQPTVEAAFTDYDQAGGGTQAAVRTALTLRSAGCATGTFADLDDLDAASLADAVDALEHLDHDGVRPGTDPTLDDLRSQAEEITALSGNAFDVLEELRAEGIRDAADLREAVVRYLSRETSIDIDTIRRAAPEDAADEVDYVSATLRTLGAALESEVEAYQSEAVAEYEDIIESARDDIEDAVAALDHVALYLSLARFAIVFDLTPPAYVTGRDVLAVEDARNLELLDAGDPVQPVTYAIGTHDIDGPPNDDRVAVLTGANSGGKTTLLETLCQVAILAHMGLPVPAARALVSPVDAIVFHRRHASFNAGVLESTLKTIVPPLAGGGRTIMLVDEFEAITEPGSAADLLHGLVTLTVDRNALGVFVTHLAEDLRPLPDTARIDGISAHGLDEELNLVVDYQPEFGSIGRSTPEFIVSRLVANAADRTARAGFETLATALGADSGQRSLADQHWAR